MHLRGRWLVLARAAWVAALALTLGLFAAGIPVVAGETRVPCAGADCPAGSPPRSSRRS